MSSDNKEDDTKSRRSQAWFGSTDRDGFIHRSWMKNQGHPGHLFDGRPVIGICNTWSELTPCNAHFRDLAEFIKRGVYEAGGFPLEFPVTSLGETLMRPTAAAGTASTLTTCYRPTAVPTWTSWSAVAAHQSHGKATDVPGVDAGRAI